VVNRKVIKVNNFFEQVLEAAYKRDQREVTRLEEAAFNLKYPTLVKEWVRQVHNCLILLSRGELAYAKLLDDSLDSREAEARKALTEHFLNQNNSVKVKVQPKVFRVEQKLDNGNGKVTVVKGWALAETPFVKKVSR